MFNIQPCIWFCHLVCAFHTDSLTNLSHTVIVLEQCYCWLRFLKRQPGRNWGRWPAYIYGLGQSNVNYTSRKCSKREFLPVNCGKILCKIYLGYYYVLLWTSLVNFNTIYEGVFSQSIAFYLLQSFTFINVNWLR